MLPAQVKRGHGHKSQPPQPALLSRCSAWARTRGQGTAGWGRRCSRRGEASTSPSLLGQGREMVRALPAGRGGTRGEGTSLIAQLPSVTVQQHFCPKPSPVPAESAGAGTRSQDKLLQGFLAQRKKRAAKFQQAPGIHLHSSCPRLHPQAEDAAASGG